jgi:hypothetical protein
MDTAGNIARAARNLITEHGNGAERIALTRANNAAKSNREAAAIAWSAVAAAVRRLRSAIDGDDISNLGFRCDPGSPVRQPLGPQIMITCEQTGQAVSTGMLTDQTTWRKLAANWKGGAFICPACGAMHAWIKSDAFLAAPRRVMKALQQ